MLALHHHDLAHCREMIRTGSYSFHAASRVLPASVRDPALVLYAFCRCADDLVDESQADGRAQEVLRLEERLSLVYEGRPLDTPVDRAFAQVVETFDMPRALPEALLEGLAWDALGRRYGSLEDLHSYSARVASAVGAMMCVLMRVRDEHALARACDLGLAMQLTNIARDVGEDARAGRLYLPTDWFAEAGRCPEEFLRDPKPDAHVRSMVKRLVIAADHLYRRADAGISTLPVSCRAGIFAARRAYAAIASAVRASNYDSITTRAHTSRLQKVGYISLAILQSGVTLGTPQSALLYAPGVGQIQFLIDAVTGPTSPQANSRASAVIDILIKLRQQEAARWAQQGKAPAR